MSSCSYIIYIAPEDYSSFNTLIPISRSFVGQQVNVFINDDQLLEDNEQFTVSLQLSTGGSSCGVALGSITTATVNIIDNDGEYKNLGHVVSDNVSSRKSGIHQIRIYCN